MSRNSQSDSIHSKYENSSNKIKQLYTEFQHLKKRISTPIKQRRQPMLSFYDNNYKNYSTQLRPASTSIVSKPKKQDYDLGASNMIDHETRIFLKNTFQKFVNKNMSGLQNKMDQNVQIMQQRILNISKLLVQVQRISKLKLSNINTIKQIKCNCKWKGTQIKQIEDKYSKKIQQLKQAYENKISLLLKDVETSGSSDTKRIAREIEGQLKIGEEKLLIKQEQITKLKTQLIRIRRTYDQKQKLYEQKQTLLAQMTKQAQQKTNQLLNYKKQSHNIRKQCDERMRIQIDKKEAYQQKIQMEVQSLLNKNQKLQNQIAVLKAEVENKNQHYIIKSAHKSHINQWNFSEIDDKSVVNSDFDEQQVISNLKIDPVDNLEPLRHSHFICTNKNKRSFNLQGQLRQLESELQLVIQQNRVLKQKKDKFEDQVKQNESDQQKFQMQGQLLKDELKRTNMSIKNLDECAYTLFKGNKLILQKVQLLEDGLKLKQAYFKKFPSRSSSSKKK